jgi:hypothetical protein
MWIAWTLHVVDEVASNKKVTLLEGHFTFGAQPIWAEIHLAWYLDQQMGPYFANGPIVGPLCVKLFDPFQGPISYRPKFCNWGQGKPWPIFLA